MANKNTWIITDPVAQTFIDIKQLLGKDDRLIIMGRLSRTAKVFQELPAFRKMWEALPFDITYIASGPKVPKSIRRMFQDKKIAAHNSVVRVRYPAFDKVDEDGKVVMQAKVGFGSRDDRFCLHVFSDTPANKLLKVEQVVEQWKTA